MFPWPCERLGYAPTVTTLHLHQGEGALQPHTWRVSTTVAIVVSLLVGLAGLGFGLWDLHKFNSLNGSINATAQTAVDHSVPATSIVLPAAGATVSGSAFAIDVVPIGPSIKAVELFVTGGAAHNEKIGDAAANSVGWLMTWNTKNLPNGTYQLTSVGFNTAGKSSRSASVTVTVKN
jgi:hypothetical protein